MKVVGSLASLFELKCSTETVFCGTISLFKAVLMEALLLNEPLLELFYIFSI